MENESKRAMGQSDMDLHCLRQLTDSNIGLLCRPSNPNPRVNG